MFLPQPLVQRKRVLVCMAPSRFYGNRGGEDQERPPAPSRCPAGCITDFLAVGAGSPDYGWITASSCFLTSLPPPPPPLFSPAAAEAGRRHFPVVSSSPYLCVSVKNVGGPEDGGRTEHRVETCSWLAGGSLLRIPLTQSEGS